MLRALAEMPFIDRTGLAAITGWSRGAVHGALANLDRHGLCDAVTHATGLFPAAERFHLTARGLERLAGDEDISLEELLRAYPVSDRWRNILLERLDALAAVYRIAAVLSGVARPIRLRWYRALPLDAAVSLPDGRTVGVVRRGHTADRSPFAKRMWKLRQGPLPGAVLALMPDAVRLRHSRRMLDGFPVPVFLAVESDAVHSELGDPVWSPQSVNAAVSLDQALDLMDPGGELPVEAEPQRTTVPDDLSAAGPGWGVPDCLLPAVLRPAEKKASDLIGDWPWVSVKDLAGLMGVSPQRVSQVIMPLEALSLAVRPERTGGRLALTDRALAMLARRDRTSVSMAKTRWSAAPLFPGEPFHWTNVSGRQTRQLLRNLEHTAAVHSFLAAMTAQAAHLDWEVAQLDPPRRASRYFPHQGGMRAVSPDAYGVLNKGDTDWPFFLEWERRAVQPLHHVGPPGPLPAVLLLPPAHRRPRRHGPTSSSFWTTTSPRPTSCAWREEEMQAKGVDRTPVGLPPGRRGEAGAAGTRLAQPRPTRSRPRPRRPNR